MPTLVLSSSPAHLLDQFRATNIVTVDDLARLNVAQVETYPIPPPKLATIQRVLSRYHEYLHNAPTTGELQIPISVEYKKLTGAYSLTRGTNFTPPVFPPQNRPRRT